MNSIHVTWRSRSQENTPQFDPRPCRSLFMCKPLGKQKQAALAAHRERTKKPQQPSVPPIADSAGNTEVTVGKAPVAKQKQLSPPILDQAGKTEAADHHKVQDVRVVKRSVPPEHYIMGRFDGEASCRIARPCTVLVCMPMCVHCACMYATVLVCMPMRFNAPHNSPGQQRRAISP